MVKFINDEIEFLDVAPINVSKSQSLAGGTYIEHAGEINEMIDEANRINAEAYQKACFCSIGS